MSKGYTHIYTGKGKGKTTAALGLALRAAGAGLRVFFAQFIKQRKCSEHKALALLGDNITVKQYGTGFIKTRKTENGSQKSDMAKHKAMSKKGFEEVKAVISSNQYDMVILDEINVAQHYGLVTVEELLYLMQEKPSGVELVLTGRYADAEVIKKADLVTEMNEVKHYYKKGVKARKGIEC